MNNSVEKDHRFAKRRVKPCLGLFSYQTAWRTVRGYEMMNMIGKGQIEGVERGKFQRTIYVYCATVWHSMVNLNGRFDSRYLFATEPHFE